MSSPQRPPRFAAREARTAVYRSHILESAEQVFAERGVESATLQEIGRRVGLSMGTIYSVFPSKVDLLGAILDDRGTKILRLVTEVVRKSESPKVALSRLLEGYIDFFLGHRNFLRMHLRQGSAWILSPDIDEGSRVRVWSEVHRLQAEIFRQGLRDRSFVGDDPELMSKLFSAIDQVVLSDWVASGMKGSRESLVERMSQMVERLFARPPAPAGKRRPIGTH